MDEFFEVLTLTQTGKMLQVPLILVGNEYWNGLLQWVKEVMMEKENNISPKDFELVKLADTADEVAKHAQQASFIAIFVQIAGKQSQGKGQR